VSRGPREESSIQQGSTIQNHLEKSTEVQKGNLPVVTDPSPTTLRKEVVEGSVTTGKEEGMKEDKDKSINRKYAA